VSESESARNVADEFFPGLVEVLTVLEPYLSEMVVVGEAGCPT